MKPLAENEFERTLEGPLPSRPKAWQRCLVYAGMLRDKGLTHAFGVEIRPTSTSGNGLWSVVLVQYAGAERDGGATLDELRRDA